MTPRLIFGDITSLKNRRPEILHLPVSMLDSTSSPTIIQPANVPSANTHAS
jgi:hypothetical protein